MSAVLHVVPGPEQHGVTRHALDLLARNGLREHSSQRLFTEGAPAADEAASTLAQLPDADLLHLHLTDHLLAPTAGECADLVAALMDRRPVSLTLHDLPQPADGPGRYERRRGAYATMAARARGVVVASRHERDLLLAALDAEGLSAPPIEIIPLPIEAPDAPQATGLPDSSGPTDTARNLVVFGYLYPGKGHAAALEALADLPVDVGLLAVGQVSDGHDDLVDELRTRADELGRRFTVTGFVDDAEIISVLQAAAVPVAPHRHISASGSIGSWLSAGRRPLVPAGGYVDELAERAPGALLRYGPGLPHADLAAAARAALADPSLTWLGGDGSEPINVGPDGDAVAAHLADVLDSWARDVNGATS